MSQTKEELDQWRIEYKQKLKDHYSQWFKTERFWYSWDTHFDKHPEHIKEIQLIEELTIRLEKSLGLKIDDIHKLVYLYIRRHTHLYFALVIKNKEIFHIACCKKRNQIGQLLGRFFDYNVIIWYPSFNSERFYIPNQKPFNDDQFISQFHGHKRVKGKDFQ